MAPSCNCLSCGYVLNERVYSQNSGENIQRPLSLVGCVRCHMLSSSALSGHNVELIPNDHWSQGIADVTDNCQKYWIGFDLGGTKMQCCLFDLNMKLVACKRRRTKGELGVEAGLQRIEATINKLLEESKIQPSQLAGIGMGCPGPVEWETGIVRVAVNLGWKDVAVGKYLKSKFGCPVALLNDVDAGVYGEYRDGAGKGSRTTLGIFPGTGIGGGCVYDGQILRGKILSCMEIGHIKISGSPRTGASGMTGTLETEASRLAIAGEIAKLAYRGEAPYTHKVAATELTAIRSKTIAEAIDKGDKEVLKVVEAACDIIGQAVANMVLLMCPDCIVLGGGLVEAMPELFLREVTKSAKKNVFECYRDQFEIRCAKLGDDAGAVGAAYWVAKLVSDAESEASKKNAKGKIKNADSPNLPNAESNTAESMTEESVAAESITVETIAVESNTADEPQASLAKIASKETPDVAS
jgi:glucokinase